MANNTEVLITLQGDVLVADMNSIPAIAGDTVTFRTDPDTSATLCMTAETAAILSPAPGDAQVQIPPGGAASFRFLSGATGGYYVALQFPDLPCPTDLDRGSSGQGTLTILASSRIQYPGGSEEDGGTPGGLTEP